MTEWLGVVVPAGLAALVGHEVWRRRARRRFLRRRPLLPDAALCQAVAASPEEGPWWVELRRALAEQCGLPAEAVHPDDALDTLEAMTFDGWDFRDLLFTLEERLRMPIRRLAEEHPSTGEAATTVRGLGDDLVRILRAFVPSGEGAGQG